MNEIRLTTFAGKPEAQELIDLLESYGVPARLESVATQPNTGIASGNSAQQFEVYIAETHREKAREILEQGVEVSIQDVDPDYYLFDFTDDELVGVLVDVYEWSEFDVSLSKQILTSRNALPEETEIEKLRLERLETLAKPEKNAFWMILFGYVCAFGFLGLLIGYALCSSKKVLPDGTKAYVYSEGARKHGYVIVVISVVVIALWLLQYLYNPLDR